MNNNVSSSNLSLTTKVYFLTGMILILALMMSAPTPTLQAQHYEPDVIIIDVSADQSSESGIKKLDELHVRSDRTPTACTAEPPTLLTPTQNAITNDIAAPAFTWQSVDGISEYILQIAFDENFGNLLTTEREVDLIGEGVIRRNVLTSLNQETQYFWRIASVCPDGEIGAFSDPFSFETGAGSDEECTLDPPEMLTPDQGKTVDTLLPSLMWRAEDDIFEYQFQIARNPNFSPLEKIVNFVGIQPQLMETVQYIPRENLLFDTEYYWRVASTCAEIDASGAYSEPRSFFAPEETDVELPLAPELLFPNDQSVTGSYRVIISFAEVAESTGYLVTFHRSLEEIETGTTPRSIGPFNQSSVITVFNPNETWYWRAAARYDFGWGAFSEPRSFTTPTAAASGTITPEAGGTFMPDPGFLTVQFPPDAVTQETELDFELFAVPQVGIPGDYQFGNRSFALTATADGEPVTMFEKPFTMTIKYDTAELLLAGIVNPEDLNVVYWNGTEWTEILPCEGCGINTATSTVTLVLDHLTEFALVAPVDTTQAINRVYLPAIMR